MNCDKCGLCTVPIVRVLPPHPGADCRAREDEQLPDPDRQEDDPVAPGDVAIESERKQQAEHQQARVDDELTARQRQARVDDELTARQRRVRTNRNKIGLIPAAKPPISIADIQHEVSEKQDKVKDAF